MIALLVSRQLGLHAATRLDKHSLVHSVAYLGGMCGDTGFDYVDLCTYCNFTCCPC